MKGNGFLSIGSLWRNILAACYIQMNGCIIKTETVQIITVAIWSSGFTRNHQGNALKTL